MAARAIVLPTLLAMGATAGLAQQTTRETHPADQAGFRPFGAAVAWIHDANGDGLADLLVTAPQGIPRCAPAAVYSTDRGEILREIHGEPFVDSHLGVSVTVLGDLDGDEVADVALGGVSIRAHGSIPGVVRVYSGRTWKPLRVLGRNDLAGSSK